MQDSSTTKSTSSTRKIRPPADIAITTALTMVAVLLLSNFSIQATAAIGSFTGCCVAAWNWFRMGRRRKAFVHLLLGFGIYLLVDIGNLLLAFLGKQLPSTLVVVLLLLFDLAIVVLVTVYLYEATNRDVHKVRLNGELVENYNFLPLLGIAALSVGAILAMSTVLHQVSVARIQNHIYCEVLQLGMTNKEVNTALNEVGPQMQVWFEGEPYPSLSEKASYYRVVYWDNYRFDADYNLSLWLGYDTKDQLVWIGRFWLDTSEEPYDDKYDTIECPWTFSQSVTAR